MDDREDDSCSTIDDPPSSGDDPPSTGINLSSTSHDPSSSSREPRNISFDESSSIQYLGDISSEADFSKDYAKRKVRKRKSDHRKEETSTAESESTSSEPETVFKSAGQTVFKSAMEETVYKTARMEKTPSTESGSSLEGVPDIETETAVASSHASSRSGSVMVTVQEASPRHQRKPPKFPLKSIKAFSPEKRDSFSSVSNTESLSDRSSDTEIVTTDASMTAEVLPSVSSSRQPETAMDESEDVTEAAPEAQESKPEAEDDPMGDA